MNEYQQIRFVPDGTQEQAQAVSLHYEILSTAQAAADNLLTLGRKLKKMRDSRGYERLGYESFAQYTEQAVGIRQRQAYNYISVVEKVPAQLVEENAAAGVTKLALLGRLAPAQQQEVAGGGELASITVAELQQLIDEKNGLAEQLSLLQAEPVEAQASEVDLDSMLEEARRAALEDADRKHRKEMAQMEQSCKEAAAKEAAKKIADARREGEEKARKQMQADNAAVMAEAERVVREAKQAAEAARRQAEAADARAAEVAKELELAASPESTRFALLFDNLQQKAQTMLDLADSLEKDGRETEARRYRGALRQALEALAEQAGAQQLNVDRS